MRAPWPKFPRSLIGDLVEALQHTWTEWRARKPRTLTDRELQQVIEQDRFERYVLGTARAE
jgi:hypothetical protein